VSGELSDAASRDFEATFGPWIEPGYRLAVAMLRDREEAQDAVQESALKAWRSIGSLRDSNRARAWFLSIVANQCRSTMRRRWWGILPLATRDTVQLGPEESSVQSQDLRNAMKRLRPDDRALLYLHYFLDLPMEEVASVLGISTGAAKTRVYRAAHLLRPELELTEEDLR